MKLKLHPRIKISVEFSDVGVVKPNGEFEVDETRANELIQLNYAEPVKTEKSSVKPSAKGKKVKTEDSSEETKSSDDKNAQTGKADSKVNSEAENK